MVTHRSHCIAQACCPSTRTLSWPAMLDATFNLSGRMRRHVDGMRVSPLGGERRNASGRNRTCIKAAMVVASIRPDDATGSDPVVLLQMLARPGTALLLAVPLASHPPSQTVAVDDTISTLANGVDCHAIRREVGRQDGTGLGGPIGLPDRHLLVLRPRLQLGTPAGWRLVSLLAASTAPMLDPDRSHCILLSCSSCLF